jgi:hypothetical protein
MRAAESRYVVSLIASNSRCASIAPAKASAG